MNKLPLVRIKRDIINENKVFEYEYYTYNYNGKIVIVDFNYLYNIIDLIDDKKLNNFIIHYNVNNKNEFFNTNINNSFFGIAFNLIKKDNKNNILNKIKKWI